jgi:hypothetical protein
LVVLERVNDGFLGISTENPPSFDVTDSHDDWANVGALNTVARTTAENVRII